uniref:Angiopoietin 2 n=1 Tax=Gopherus evgoodei TaxID=1825980 RepID=A0A8C4VIS6_9SAUR
MWLAVYFILSCNLVLASGYSSFRKSMETIGKKQYQVQHGSCSYTFLLPEMDNCRSSSSSYVSNAVQRDAPLDYDDSVQRLQLLENIMENNTQWLMKLENYIQDNMKKEMVEIQQNAVQNQTAVMIEIGTNLLNQTAEQTRKLTDVEAQVLNQTTRLELQLLEHSLSTNKLERQISDQTNEITKLQEKNSFLEKKVLDMEDKHTLQLQSIKDEKDQLQVLVSRQNSIIEELEKQLVTATVNNSVMQKQQHDLMETVHNLQLKMRGSILAQGSLKQDPNPQTACIYPDNSTQTSRPLPIYPRTHSPQHSNPSAPPIYANHSWQDVCAPCPTLPVFGDGCIDQMLKFMAICKLFSRQTIESLFFRLTGAGNTVQIQLKGLTGTAGKISSISQPGNDFSTKDADNDKCICKCSQMLTGGWWFDACGPSNLNGMYYPLRQNTNKFNGIKWYYWKGSGYSLKATTMMIRPADF